MGGEASSLESSTSGGGVSREVLGFDEYVLWTAVRCGVVVCDGVSWVRVGDD